MDINKKLLHRDLVNKKNILKGVGLGEVMGSDYDLKFFVEFRSQVSFVQVVTSKN